MSTPPVPLPIEELAARLDEATARLDDLDPAARTVVTSALEAMGALHRAALTTVVRRLKDDPHGKPLLFELVDDPQVRMVLSMHGIIRPDPLVLARQVLDRLRPDLEARGADVELVSVSEGVARVRLTGVSGCSSTAAAIRHGLESALVAEVPGVVSMQVLPREPTPTLIPLSSLRVGPPAPRAADVPRGPVPVVGV